MVARRDDWRAGAMEAYAAAQDELARWSSSLVHSDDVEVEFFLDDLREAMLDLKQATIEGRPSDARTFVIEIYTYLRELHRRGES